MDPTNLLISLLGLMGLWVAAYYLWPDFRNDAFRDDIFSVRDEMFRYAAEGNVSFSDPAYTILRLRMNALLRHGLDMTLVRLLILRATCKNVRSESFIAWQTALGKLPLETRSKLEEFDFRTTIFVFQHVLYASLFRYLLVRPFMTFIDVRVLSKSSKVKCSVERLETASLEEEEASELVAV